MSSLSMKRKVKQLCLMVLAGVFVLSSAGCEEGDVAVGVIVGGIVGGLIGAADGGYDSGPRCHGGYRTECREWRDRWGDWRQECREVYDDCADYYSNDSSFAKSEFLDQLGLQAKLAASDAVSGKTAHFAQKLEVSFTAAERLVKALGQAENGDLSGLQALGLDGAAMEKMGRLKMPSQHSIQKLALSLNIESEQAENLLQDILSETKEQAGHIDSPLWQACLAAGSWQTPQNQFCQETYWSGCSPEMGASLCVPAQ